jgi:hypothetical protein
MHSGSFSLARVVFFASSASLSLAGCFERSLQPVDPCTTSTQEVLAENDGPDAVDLLVLVDDSTSMAEHQAALAEQLPRLIQVLTSGDRDHDGAVDFRPVRSLHVGIVSSDMGLGPITGVPSCNPGFGDDGVLLTRSPHPASGCQADYAGTYPRGIFDFALGGGTTPTQFASDVACVGMLGTGGCGLEFELEPILKALAPAPDPNGNSIVNWTRPGYRPPLFAGNTVGHGSDPATNGGFLRPNSVLAILTVNDEDDASTDDFEIYSPTNPMYSSAELNVRPVAFADHLYPVQRYVDGLLGLRQTASFLVYATITGVPLPLSGHSPTEILADPSMTPRIDPAQPDRLVPVCTDTAGGQSAVPGRRMVQVAEGLAAAGATASVHSICNGDFAPAIDDLVARLAEALDSVCLERSVNPDAEGNVPCELLELLPAIETGGPRCASLPHPEAYTYVRTEAYPQPDGGTLHRELCRVRQVGRAGAGVQAGWAYDDGNPALGAWSALPTGCGQRVGFSVVSAMTGSEVALLCTETVLPATTARVQLGDFCDPSNGATTNRQGLCSEGHAVAGNPQVLACDPFARACEVACTTDADCTEAGLLSYVCDRRTALEVYGSASQIPSDLSPDTVRGFCVNPTCGDR